MARKHDISLNPGKPNDAAGHCLYESIIDNVTNRVCFNENLDNTPEFYRNVWMTEGEKKCRASDYYPGPKTEEQWKDAWKRLQETSDWDIDYFGDLAIGVCADALRKDILVINTQWQTKNAFASQPISVIFSDHLDKSNTKNNDAPLKIHPNLTLHTYIGEINHFGIPSLNLTLNLIRVY